MLSEVGEHLTFLADASSHLKNRLDLETARWSLDLEDLTRSTKEELSTLARRTGELYSNDELLRQSICSNQMESSQRLSDLELRVKELDRRLNESEVNQ